MKFREECGVFGVIGPDEAAQFTALGLHALQHRGQEACGIVAYDNHSKTFNNVRRIGYVRDHFTKPSVMNLLPGSTALGHVRYSTAGSKGAAAIRDTQPLFAEFSQGGVAIAHNGNLTNAEALRNSLIAGGSIFQSRSDTECIIHLMAKSGRHTATERMKHALFQVQGAYSIVAMTRTKLIGVRDPIGFRPLVLGRLNSGYVFASETCALDAIGATLEREVEPGEMLVVDRNGIQSEKPFPKRRCGFCIFEYIYFSRADSIHNKRSVYETRQRIGVELAKESPAEADVVCPVPDSGIAAAIGYAQQCKIPFAFGIIRSAFAGRTFIEPTESIRNMGVKLKLNINKPLIEGKRVVLVDDSVVRGTTIRKIGEMIQESGAKEVHVRIASPPTRHPCYYGVDTPQQEHLLAWRMSEDEMANAVGVNSLKFVTIQGLYRACGEDMGRDNVAPQYCDACFTGEYPIPIEPYAGLPKLPLDVLH